MKLPKELNHLLSPDDWPGISNKEDAQVYKIAEPVVNDIMRSILSEHGNKRSFTAEEIVATIANRYQMNWDRRKEVSDGT